MKNIIKKYYQEPLVDTRAVLIKVFQQIALQETKNTPISKWIFPVSAIIGTLLVAWFGTYLFDFGGRFSDTFIELYFSLGGIASALIGLIAGTCFFIAKNYLLLLLLSICYFSFSSSSFFWKSRLASA